MANPGKTSGTAGIIALVPDLWGDYWMSRHQVLSRLAEHFPVLWVSSPLYVEMWRNDGFRSTLAMRGSCKVNDRLWTYAPRLPADYKRTYASTGLIETAFRRYHAWWLRHHARQIARLAREMGMQRSILYVWRPDFAEQVDLIPHNLLCYHIVDEYSFSPDQDVPIGTDEMELLHRAELVFIHSQTLMNKKGHINPNTHYVPNGVDFDLYRTAMESTAPEPDDLRAVPHPRIGYAGYIKRHLDLHLLLELARRRRDWSLVLVGPVRHEHADIVIDIAALRNEPNVHFLGPKTAQTLPHYTKGFDVCLLPYRETAYTKYIYPLKLHEYLACGKPVVATRLDNLNEFAHVLYFADSPEAWVAQIHNALANDTFEFNAKRVSVAAQNSWRARADDITSLFQSQMLATIP